MAEQKQHSIHVRDGMSEAEFVAMRKERDATLAMLILPSVQVNVRAGKLPPAQDGGRTYLEVPTTRF